MEKRSNESFNLNANSKRNDRKKQSIPQTKLEFVDIKDKILQSFFESIRGESGKIGTPS